MHSHRNPVFRKAAIPWYRSTTACLLAIFAMLLILLFGLSGIAVAKEIETFQAYIWVPILLVSLSGALIIAISIRLIRRSSAK
jgi:prepilin signal peptidase PulO-like enzyme (type II secretory pathway)